MNILYWQSLFQGLVQAVTEFLPVSSTGHMILVDAAWKALFGAAMSETFSQVFEVFIQLGSVLAVVLYFRKKLIPNAMFTDATVRKSTFSLWGKMLVGVCPALLIGGLFGHQIQNFLFNSTVVSIALFVGGVVLILVDKPHEHALADLSEISFKKAFYIGLIQCLAMIPGTSRSASTIIGGMCLGCSRPLAAEFSFFLAIPTLCAASGYSLLKGFSHLSGPEWCALAIGFVTAFVFSLGVIAFFMNYIRTRSFKPFGWYRIVLGLVILALLVAKIL